MQSIAQLPQRRELALRLRRWAFQTAHAHQAAHANCGERLGLIEKRRHFVRPQPLFVGVSRDVDLQQHVGDALQFRRDAIDRLQQAETVDRVHQVHQRQRAADLVALQRPHQMPADIRGRDDFRFFPQRLGTALTEIGEPQRDQVRSDRRVDVFGDTDQADIVVRAASLLGGPRDPRAHHFKVDRQLPSSIGS